ncbi:hypothetical protein [Histidinibacterium aquaticum]|uniref:hypothetical protein n=1 Tax=Histidinibacterium aquaticum TaxID=2613962 RepID=UPI001CC588BF|nr:hypothetical protein [Histidinibacterium aquaticum]
MESTGLWRPDPDAQRRDVIVSFGEATLVVSDGSGRALTHWSLPAIERLNPKDFPALYAPDTEGLETLEIAEEDMIDAIERVRRVVARSRPRPGRLRVVGVALSIAAVLALGVFWLPGALIEQTLAAVPAAKRSEIGATVLGHLQRLTGPACRSPAGQQALSELRTRVLGPGAGGQLIVLPSGQVGSLYLPGGIIALGRPLVEEVEDPTVTAGHVLATAAQVQVRDPLEAILREAGLRATFRLFTTGDLPPETLSTHAETILAAPPPPPDAEVLLPLFEAAELPVRPYAYSRDETGESVLPLIEADPMEGRDVPLVMRDSDWVALQNICGG